jgi:hypothetical protein
VSAFVSSAVFVLALAIRLGSGRLVPSVAAIIGLIGAAVGGVALVRSRRVSTRPAGGSVAISFGIVALVIGGLHASKSAGSIGTGNGLAGAYAAMGLGLASMTLGMLTHARIKR